jgi:hypothetical protein
VHVAARLAGVPDAPLPVGPRLPAMAINLPVFQHVPGRAGSGADRGPDRQDLVSVVRAFCLCEAAGPVKDAVRLIRTLIAFTERYPAFWLGSGSLEP